MNFETLIKGWVSRVLPQRESDNDSGLVRLGPYGDVYTVGAVRKQHALADEGSYFVTNNGQTGIAAPAVTTFTAASPIAVIYNSDSPSNSNFKRIHFDYSVWVTTAAGSFASAGVNLQLAVVLDNGDRYTSGGTDLSNNIVSPNQDNAVRASVAKVRFGNITATAATGTARTVVGLRILRPAVSATVADVVGETKQLNSGGVEAMLNGSITVANANNIPLPLPPLIIGPNQCMLLYFIMNGTTPGAPSYAPEFAWWER